MDFRKFLALLEKKGLLIRVKEKVSSVLEITEIHKRIIEKNGPAILFENVVTEYGTSKMPVLVNLFGTVERVALALSCKSNNDLRKLGEEFAFLRQPKPPASIKEAVSMMPMLKNIIAMSPKIVTKARCQQIVYKNENHHKNEKFDIRKILPIQTCWPNEPAPLITWGAVVTKKLKSENDYNVGIYRAQVINEDKLILRWLKHRGGSQHYHEWKKKFPNNREMPVAIVIGGNISFMLSAVMPIPETISEYNFAGVLAKKKLQLVECKTIPFYVPADAEIIIEGVVNLDELADEGPYGDHTGFYNSVEKFPVMKVTAITTCKEPLYLSTFTGRPPDEPSILGEALNEIFIPLLQQQFPEIQDFWLPPECCSYRVAVVSIKKAYPGHASRIMMGIWSYLRQFMYVKFIIIVDHDINVRSWSDVMWAVSTQMDFHRDVTIIKNTPIDYLDFASIESELGSKIGFDATSKIPPETKREWGRKITMDNEIEALVTEKWEKYFKKI